MKRDGPMRRARWFALAVTATVTTAVASGRAHADDFQVSFQAGVRDAAGRFAGGTEMRLLTTHGGKLSAGNGYWEDRPGPEGRQGAEILVLDAPLSKPISLLLASTWDLTGAARVFTRDDETGAWSAVTLAEDRPAPDFLPQIRSFATHRDRATGVDLVFAGEMPRGIFAGSYDPAAPGRIRWRAAPEL